MSHVMTEALAASISGGHREGFSVVLGQNPGYDPATDTLYLPYAFGPEVPQDARDLLAAFVGHEAGEREFATWDPVDARWKDKPQLKALINGVLDVRVNRMQAKEYRGFRSYMSRCNERFAEQNPTLQETPASVGIAFYRILEGVPGSIELVEEQIPDYWFDYAAQFLPFFEKYWADEEVVIDLCIKLYDMLKFKELEKKNPSACAGGKGPPNPEADPKADNAPALTAQEKVKIDSVDESQVWDDPTPQQQGGISEQLTDAISEAYPKSPTDETYRYDTQYDKELQVKSKAFASQLTKYTESEARLATAALTTLLRRLFRGMERKDVRLQERGRLDPRRLVQVITETDDRVFKRKKMTDDIGTAVMVSCDFSGSMNQALEDVLFQCEVWARALQAVDVNFAVEGWTTQYNPGQKLYASAVHRDEPMHYYSVHPFGQKWRTPHLVRNPEIELGATPSAEGLLHAAVQLRQQPQENKVLVYITDGYPGISSNGHYNDAHERFLKEIVATLPSWGITFVPVALGGFADRTFTDLFGKDWLNATNGASMFRLATNAMVRLLRN